MDPQVVLEAADDSTVGSRIGQCKWFNDKLGYGFITVQAGEDKGKDIFVHHSGIKPLNSNYKTLKKGEYINFNIVDGDNGLQAVNVTGIGGGSLMCDVLPSIKLPMPSPMQVDQQGFTMVVPRVHRGPPRGPYRQRSSPSPMQT
jgi:CspA family cold shock protein